jgi:hypothetical protein
MPGRTIQRKPEERFSGNQKNDSAETSGSSLFGSSNGMNGDHAETGGSSLFLLPKEWNSEDPPVSA